MEPTISSVSVDAEGLTPLASTTKHREWVDPCGVYVLARLTPDVPRLPATVAAVEQSFLAADQRGRGRLLHFEPATACGVRGILFVVQMTYTPEGMTSVGASPSYSATLTLPFQTFSVHLNAAYNLELARRAPSRDEHGFAPLDDPPGYLLVVLRRLAETLELDEALLEQAPWFLDA